MKRLVGVLDPASRWIYGDCEDTIVPGQTITLKKVLLCDGLLMPTPGSTKVSITYLFRTMNPSNELIDLQVIPTMWHEVPAGSPLYGMVERERTAIQAANAGLTLPEGSKKPHLSLT